MLHSGKRIIKESTYEGKKDVREIDSIIKALGY